MMRADDTGSAPLPPEVREYIARALAFQASDRDDSSGYLGRLRASFPVAPDRDSLPSEVSIESISIPDGQRGLAARLYRSLAPGSEAAGLAIFFHGGGWVAGHPEHYDSMCAQLCRGTGAAILSVDYRLAPEFPFPAAADDAGLALSWANANRSVLGITGPIGLIGVSAGGNLAASASLRARDEDAARPAYQVLIYPVLDRAMRSDSYRRNGVGFATTAEQLKWFWEQYGGQGIVNQLDEYFSPAGARDLSSLPPTFAVVAEFDPLRDEAIDFVSRLRGSAVTADVVEGRGMVHGFLSLFGSHPESQRAMRAVVEFVRSISNDQQKRADA